jgi:hypothetical protein
MIPAMIDAVADQHLRELRCQAARRQAAARHRDRPPAGAPGRPPRLRRHLGFALVEAGFYLLSSARLASRD